MGRGRGKGGDDEFLYGCGAVCCGIGLLLFVILLPLSFTKLEYYEAGLLQQKSTGTTDTDKVWEAGNHFIGPDFTFKKFPISIQLFNQRLDVWSKSGGADAGATLTLDISFQYKIRKNEIPALYQKVALDFEPLVVTYALDAIKNTAPLYGVDEYLTSRPKIEAAFMANVTKALKDDIFCDVLDLQLRRIILSNEYEETKLQAAIQFEKSQQAAFDGQREVVEAETEAEVQTVTNQASIVEKTAIADAKVITESATYNAKKHVEQQRSDGLKLMLQELGLTTDEHKASLDYITTLINNKESITPFVNLGTDLLQKQIS